VVAGAGREEDTDMPEATTVWMVQLDRSPDDVEGTLSLEHAAIRFVPSEAGSPREIDLTDVSRVKRIWGSPVMMVHSVEDGQRHVTAFYFSKPPPLHPPAEKSDEPPPTLMGPFNRNRPPSKRKQRRSNAGYLANASTSVGDDVRAWAKETRAAVAAARTENA
jgi:hypothetical protein